MSNRVSPQCERLSSALPTLYSPHQQNTHMLGLKEKSRGLLEVTALVSGDHRKTNDPKAPNGFFRRQRQRGNRTRGRENNASARSNAPDSSTSTPAHNSSSRGLLGGLLRRNPAASSNSAEALQSSSGGGSSRDHRRGGILRVLTGSNRTSTPSAGLPLDQDLSAAHGIVSADMGTTGDGDGGGGGDDCGGGGGSGGRTHSSGVAPATPPSQAPSHGGSSMGNGSPPREGSTSSPGRHGGRLPEPSSSLVSGVPAWPAVLRLSSKV